MWDSINKWWNRKWSDWEFKETVEFYSSAWNKKYKLPSKIIEVYKSTSNDGLVRYKRIKVS